MTRNKPAFLEALADVKELRRRVLDRQLFFGYSGPARISGGCIALIGAWLLSQSWISQTPQNHLIGWGIICATAFTVNFGAVAYWWRARQADLDQLRPILDLVAPFTVGGLLTCSLISHAQYDLLFPMWMWLFGLMHIASRHSMPRSMLSLGWSYIGAGIVCILSLPHTAFTNPWPMGLTFALGEIFGGVTFLTLRKEEEV
jgi:hypothetical protein